MTDALFSRSATRHHLLFLRCCLLLASVMLMVWAGLDVCMADILVWNSALFLINAVHVVLLAYRNVPVSTLCRFINISIALKL